MFATLKAKSITAWLVSCFIAVSFVFVAGPAVAAPNPATGPSSGGTAVTIQGIHFVSVHTGENFSLGLTDQGTVYAWGRNDNGQLGDGTTTNSFTPVPVKGEGGVGILSGVTSLAVGFYHSLAVTSNGLYSWGYNRYGALGINSTTNSLTPIKVMGVGGAGELTGVTSVSAGGYHSLAMTEVGVYAWGANYNGQLGNGNLTDQHSPVQVLGLGGSGFLSGITKIAAGDSHCIASSTSGVFGWGANNAGQLGDGTNTDSPVPVQVLGVNGSGLLGPADSLKAGAAHSLALSSGYIRAWGNGSFGQLGNGTRTSSLVPVLVMNPGNSSPLNLVSSIGAANLNSYALTPSGTYAWGENGFGELGNGLTVDSTLPTAILQPTGSAALPAAISIDGGNEITNILTSDGIYSAGSNYYGQFGDSSTTNSLRITLGPNFVPSGIQFGGVSGTNFSTSQGSMTASSPLASAGSVFVNGIANVFGGTVASTPSTVSWNAGTFTYEAALANTGSSDALPLGLASAGAVLLGAALLLALRRQQQK